MATEHDPSKNIPRPIGWHGFARNTLPVQAALGKKLWNATNHCVAYRRKTVFHKCMNLQSIRSGASGTQTLWYGRFHAGHGATHIIARVGMAPMGTSGSSGEIYLTVGGTDTNKLVQAPTANNDVASDYSYGKIIYGVSENTTYEWSLKAVDYARPFSLTIYEIGDQPVNTGNGATVDPRLGVQSPITSAQHQDIHQAHWDLWRHNACHLFNWTQDDENSAYSISGATYTNIFDRTTTGGAASTAPGFYLQTTRHNRVNHDVPIVFAFYGASASGGSTSSVQLVDNSNTKLAEITSIGSTEQWYTTTATLTAGNTLCTIEAKRALAVSVNFKAFSIYEYLA